MKIFKQFIGQVKAIDTEERTITAYVSTGDRDRVNEEIPANEWNLKNYNKNPVILWAHDYRHPPIGKALWTKIDKTGLMQKIQFAKTAFAEDIFQLYKGGFLNAFSVGFDADRDEKDQNIFRNAELLEVSCVPVPCNQNALAERMADGSIKSPEALAVIKGMVDETNRKPEPEETENHIRVRVRNPNLFEEGSFRTVDIDKSQGINSVMGHLKGETTMTVQNYMFDKRVKDWTIPKAVAWVKEHGKEYSPEEIAAFEAAVKQKSADEIIDDRNELIAEIGRLKAATEKEGRVLSSKNRTLIAEAVKALQSLLEATDPDAEPEKAAPVKNETIDKQKKSVIINNKVRPETRNIAEIIGKAVEQADIPGMISKEINRLRGTVD